MIINNDLIQSFNDNGYIIIDNLISNIYIESAFKSIENILDISLNNLGHDPKKIGSIDSKYEFLAKNHSSLKSHCYDILKYTTSLNQIVTNTELLNIVAKFLDTYPDRLLVDYPQYRIDDKTNTRMTAMHQEGYGQLSLNSINVWIPLQIVNKDTGTLALIPKSHLDGWLPHTTYNGPNVWGHGVKESLLNVDEILHINASAGSGVIFNSKIIHGSSANINRKRIRWTAVSRYSNPVNVPYLNNEKNPIRIPQEEN